MSKFRRINHIQAKEAKINSCFIALDKIFMQHNATNIYLAYIVPESVK